MNTIIFVLVAMVGILSTSFGLVWLRIRRDLTDKETGLLAASGLFLTWLASYFLPFLASDSPNPGKTVTIFGVVFGVVFGSAAYVAARIYSSMRKRDN